MAERSTAGPRPACVAARLIEQAQAGDQRAFDAIYRTYQPGLLRYLHAISPDLADDVAGATWASVAASIDRFSGDGDGFRGWLFTIARRRLTDEVRRSSRRPLRVAEPIDAADERSATDAAYDGPDWAAHVLRSVPARQADAVALRVLAGLSVRETANLLGVTDQNVRVLCHRGLAAIADALGVDPDVDPVRVPEEFLSVV